MSLTIKEIAMHAWIELVSEPVRMDLPELQIPNLGHYFDMAVAVICAVASAGSALMALWLGVVHMHVHSGRRDRKAL